VCDIKVEASGFPRKGREDDVAGVSPAVGGFYERTAAHYHHVRETPAKRLSWVKMPGGRGRIDWLRTQRSG